MGKAGTIVLDATKLKGNAALDQNKTLKAITRELTEAAQIRDLAENAKFGRKRGDERPKHLQGAENRRKRLEEAKRQIEVEQAGKDEAQQTRIEQREAEERVTGRKKRGRKPKPSKPEPDLEAKASVTDPDSRCLKTRQGFMQGYNGQAVVSLDQIQKLTDESIKEVEEIIKHKDAEIMKI